MGKRRSRSERIKYFNAPLRKENYFLHHERMHRAKWGEYCGVDADEKKTFFELCRSSVSQATMHAFFEPCALPLRALIDKDIVDTVIGDMMFHPEDMNGTS